MRRVFFAFCVLVLLVVGVSAQPVPAPVTTPPVAKDATPTPKDSPLIPAAPAPLPVVTTPLSRFEPLTAYSSVTQKAVGGVVLGSAWMAKMHQSNGRFLFGYNPALRQAIGGDHDLKQAQSVLAMAQVAKFTGDKQYATHARQTILTLLTTTKAAPNDANCLVPMQASFLCNRVGFAAFLAMAIYELPNPEEKLVEDAEKLCAFIRTQLRNDGAVDITDGADAQADATGANEYPGFALQALAVSNRVRSADWKKEAVNRGVAYYLKAFRAKPHPMLAAALTPVACELYLQTKSNDAANAVFEMNDWLCTQQIGATDPRTPQWAGGFRTSTNTQTASVPPLTADTALQVQSLACAYQLTRAVGDITREAKYLPAVHSAANFLCDLRFSEMNTRHFENTFRANILIGAFYTSPTDGNLHTDTTAHAMTGLLRFLSCGAENR